MTKGTKEREAEHRPGPDSLWRSQPETIKRFLEQRSDYEQLCVEVAYILRKLVATNGVEIALISQRAKTLDSFLEKLQRKKYDDPFTEIEDFGGVRVVCLYATDLPKIERVIQAEFEVVEKVDKFREKAPDQFGYGAIHYIVRLGKKSHGARYDDLRDLKCEVQVRTVLQDAWAIIDHHLIYKRESDIPAQIQRKLNGLAGLLETADDQFDRIREERQEYVDELAETSEDEPAFLSTEINRDSFVAYVQRQFPSLPPEAFEGQLDLILGNIDRKDYKTLQKLHSVIEPLFSHTDEIVQAVGVQKDSGSIRLAALLSTVDEKFREKPGFPSDWIEPVAQLAERFLTQPNHIKDSSRGGKPRGKATRYIT